MLVVVALAVVVAVEVEDAVVRLVVVAVGVADVVDAVVIQTLLSMHSELKLRTRMPWTRTPWKSSKPLG